jgi:hypothetical protein
VIFKNRLENSKSMMSVGMICLVIGVVLPWCLHPATQIGRELSEGVRGMFFGLSLSFNVGSAIMMRRRRRDIGC